MARAKFEINPSEFASWIAFSAIEPIGEARADLRIALATLHFVRMFCSSENSKNLKVSDFMLDFSEKSLKDDSMSCSQIDAVIATIGSVLGGIENG